MPTLVHTLCSQCEQLGASLDYMRRSMTRLQHKTRGMASGWPNGNKCAFLDDLDSVGRTRASIYGRSSLGVLRRSVRNIHAVYARRNVRPLAVLRSFSAYSGFARFKTLRNSATRERMRLCMYAFEHLTRSGRAKRKGCRRQYCVSRRWRAIDTYCDSANNRGRVGCARLSSHGRPDAGNGGGIART